MEVIEHSPNNVPDQAWREDLKQEITIADDRFRSNKNLWNFWYYSGLVGGIGFPALSALILKVESFWTSAERNDAAALLAAMGAVSGSVMAAINFRKRWVINRQARAEVQKLRIEILNPDADLLKISESLKEISEKYCREITDE